MCHNVIQYYFIFNSKTFPHVITHIKYVPICMFKVSMYNFIDTFCGEKVFRRNYWWENANHFSYNKMPPKVGRHLGTWFENNEINKGHKEKEKEKEERGA